MNNNSLFNKRVVVVTGKGGVGKTTISTILAIAGRKLGKKVLVCEINAKEKIAPSLGYDETNGDVKEFEKGLSFVNIIPSKAMQEYGLMILKSKILYNAIFNNKYVKKFLSAIPGLPEVLTWGKIRFHEQEKLPSGENKYDLIIVDAPATGHGISFLKLPIAILSVLQKGSLANEGEKLYNLLTDEKKTSIQIVTIAEELPVNEAKELYQTIKNELKMPIGNLFINSNVPVMFNNSEKELYINLKNIFNKDIDVLKKSTDYRLSREKLNQKYIKTALSSIDIPSFIFPYLFVESFSRKDFEYLADILLKDEKLQ